VGKNSSLSFPFFNLPFWNFYYYPYNNVALSLFHLFFENGMPDALLPVKGFAPAKESVP
jgi:hypothetical protein